MFSAEGSSSCVCDKGYFMEDASGNGTTVGTCRICPKGAICDEPGVTLENLPIEPMFWRSSNRSDFLEDCIFDAACIGNVRNVTNKTETNITASVCGVGYEGPLCAVCSSSYSAQGSGSTLVCEECDGDANLTVAIWIVFFALILTVSVLSCYYREKAMSNAEKATRKAELASDNIDDKIENSSIALSGRQLSEKFEDASSIWEKVQPGFKIALSYLQVVTVFFVAFDIQFPPIFARVTEKMSGIVNLNFLNLMPLGCILPSNYHRMLLGYTLIPIVLGSIAIAYYKFLGKGGDASNSRFAQ